eukprot:3990495-Alexandrium_andersonii.AAC.1
MILPSPRSTRIRSGAGPVGVALYVQGRRPAGRRSAGTAGDPRRAEQMLPALLAPASAKQVAFPGFKMEPASSADAEFLGAAEAS